MKSMIIYIKNNRIDYISRYRIGQLHDYRFLKKEFPPDPGWFEHFNVKVDLGSHVTHSGSHPSESGFSGYSGLKKNGKNLCH